MRIVVTGASGTLGRQLIRRLAQRGHDVLALARRKPVDGPASTAAAWVRLDLTAPGARHRLSETFRGADSVVHLATHHVPDRDRETRLRLNQYGTLAVASAARAVDVPHVVALSSVSAYAPAPAGAWIDESWPATGVASSPASIDAVMAEAAVARLDATVARVRPATIVPAQPWRTFASARSGRLSPRAVLRSALLAISPSPAVDAAQLVHPDDVAAAILSIVERRAGGAFNLAASPVLHRDQLCRIFRRFASGPFAAAHTALDWMVGSHLGPAGGVWIDRAGPLPLMRTERARTELGWRPEHAADETLVASLASLRGRPLARPLSNVRLEVDSETPSRVGEK